MLDLRANLIGQIDDVNNLQDVGRSFILLIENLKFDSTLSISLLASNVHDIPSAEFWWEWRESWSDLLSLPPSLGPLTPPLVCEHPAYRNIVLRALPKLQILDGLFLLLSCLMSTPQAASLVWCMRRMISRSISSQSLQIPQPLSNHWLLFPLGFLPQKLLSLLLLALWMSYWRSMAT